MPRSALTWPCWRAALAARGCHGGSAAAAAKADGGRDGTSLRRRRRAARRTARPAAATPTARAASASTASAATAPAPRPASPATPRARPASARFVAAGVAPSVAGICPQSAASTCGLDGTCDGKGRCRKLRRRHRLPAGHLRRRRGRRRRRLRRRRAAARPARRSICAPFNCDPKTERLRRRPAPSNADCAAGHQVRERELRPQAERRRLHARTPSARPGSAPTASAATSPAPGPASAATRPGRVGTCWPIDAERAPIRTSVCARTGASRPAGRPAPATASAAAPRTRPRRSASPPSCSGDRLNTAGTCNGLGSLPAAGRAGLRALPVRGRRLHQPLRQRRRLRQPATPASERQLRPEVERPALRGGERVRLQLLRRRRLLRRRLHRRLPQLRAVVVARHLRAGPGRRRRSARTCAPTRAPPRCGTDGTCDGAGGCRKYPTGHRLRRRAAATPTSTRPTSTCRRHRQLRRARRDRLRALRLQRQHAASQLHGRRATARRATSAPATRAA